MHLDPQTIKMAACTGPGLDLKLHNYLLRHSRRKLYNTLSNCSMPQTEDDYKHNRYLCIPSHYRYSSNHHKTQQHPRQTGNNRTHSNLKTGAHE